MILKASHGFASGLASTQNKLLLINQRYTHFKTSWSHLYDNQTDEGAKISTKLLYATNDGVSVFLKHMNKINGFYRYMI